MESILDFTRPHLLRDEQEFNAAVEEIDRLLDNDPQAGTADFDRLEFLSVLVRAYEQDHHPEIWKPASPPELVEFMLEQRGLTRADLYDCMGGKSRVSEFFSGSRRLSIGQIVALREKLRIPADMLIGTE